MTYNYSAAEQTIDEENRYFLSIVKRRRVLGLKSRSITFSTDKRLNSKHLYDEDLGSVTRMVILTRAFLLNLLDIENDVYSLHGIIYSRDLEIAKKLQLPLSEIFQSLQVSVSFRLFEYEKQLFYIKAINKHMKPTVCLRAIYNLDYSKYDFQDIDIDLTTELVKGIDLLAFLHDSISFR